MRADFAQIWAKSVFAQLHPMYLLMEILEIRKIFKREIKEKVKENYQKFVPSSQRIYGVKVPTLNDIAKRIKEPDFDLVEKLWKSGVFEERLLATKILGRICKKDAEKTLKLIKKFSKDISDWAVCDTLATQGIRKITKIKQKEIYELSKKLVLSKNFWQRRFGLVLLINFKKDKNLKKNIKKILKKVEQDKEYYVKKAIVWLKKELEKYGDN